MSEGGNVLRVLGGRLSGTQKQLPDDGRISIGHQFWQDVVIRDAAVKGHAVDLVVSDGGAAQVTVLEGSIELLGSTVDAGQTALLPPYVPFTIGGIPLAWGDPESPRWSEAGGLALAKPSPPPLPPSAREHAVTWARGVGGQIDAGITRKVIGAGLALLLVVALLVGLMPAIDALGLRGSPAERVQRALTARGLTDLQVVRDGDAGGVVVRGLVRSDADRQKVESVLRDTYSPGRVEVQTTEELAQASVDVAQMRGFTANARSLGRGVVELHTTPLSAEQRPQLFRAVNTDVRGIKRLVIRDDLPAIDDQPLKTISDATKKVSTVVVGDPSFVQTVDGGRYFTGALMPSGHRLVRFEGDTVVFEKNGKLTRVSF